VCVLVCGCVRMGVFVCVCVYLRVCSCMCVRACCVCVKEREVKKKGECVIMCAYVRV